MSIIDRDVESIVNTITDYIDRNRLEEAVKLFDSLDPPKAMDIVIRLNSDERRKLFASSSLNNLVDVLARLPDEFVYEIASVKGVDDMAKIIIRLPIDETADVLLKLPSKMRIEILRLLPSELLSDVLKVMKFPPESVGGIMTTQIPIFDKSTSVGETIDLYIQKNRLGLYDRHSYIYVIDGERKLIGRIDIKTLLTKPREARLDTIVEKIDMYVDPFSDREEAAKIAIAYDLIEIPVVDMDGRLLGIVTLDDILDVVVSEHTEDLLKYGGLIETIKGSYIAISPIKLAIKRAPMLIYLYLMNIITGGITAVYEDVIQRIALLAAFLPMLADNSGNIGSQATALILRGLITGEIKLSRSDLAKILLKEFITVGIMLMFLAPLSFIIGFSISYITKWSLEYAIAVASIVTIALIASCYVSDIIGSLLPILLVKMKVDPAVASAPVVTSIGDIITVLVYFTIASLIFRL